MVTCTMLIEKGRLLFVFFYYLYFHRIKPVLLQIANIKQWMHCNWCLQCILSIVKQRRSEYANVLHRRTCWTNKLDMGWHYTPYVTPYFIQFTLTYFKSTLRLFSFIMSVLPFYIVCQIKN